MPSKLVRSFKFAISGLYYCFKTQRNMKIHLIAAVLVFAVSIYLHLETDEFLFVATAIALVLTTEALNTSLEKVVDMLAPHYHPQAEIAKNVAAGAVLVSAIYALIVGITIFGGKLLNLN